MKIYMGADYIKGHIRGHYEGEIDMTQEQEDEFKVLLEKEINKEKLTNKEYNKLEGYKEWIRDKINFFIDAYEIDEIGNCCWEEISYN